MASSSSFTRKFTWLVVLALCFAVLPARVGAAAPAEEQILKEHVFKFYLDPALVPDMEFAKAMLPKYVADMNTILAKNTSRRLVFNPETDIILTSTRPQTNYAFPPLPVTGFEIWAHAVYTNFPISHSGYAGVDVSGAGVLAGLRWTRIYNPDSLTSAELNDYWTQIHLMVHEMAHVFGAGLGEYYNLFMVKDNTGMSPVREINIYDPADPFWATRQDFMTDPLLRNPIKFASVVDPLTRENLLAYVRFSSLTAAIISSDYRNAAPTVDLANIGVRVLDGNGMPLESAIVRVWSVSGTSPNPSQLMVSKTTGANGGVSFAWGGASNPHNSNDMLRLVKVYKDGYEAFAGYVSIFDTDVARIVDGSQYYEMTVRLQQADGVQASSIFTDVSTSFFAWRSIETMYMSGITSGCSPSPLRYCPDQFVTRGQMAVFLGRATKGVGFTPPAVPVSFTDTLDHSARYWIEALASDGITTGCGNGSFCPDKSVSRAQMAIFLLRAMHGAGYKPPAASGTVFLDTPADHWASAWVEQLARENITGGCGNGNFCPDAPVTRAQMAVFLVKAFRME